MNKLTYYLSDDRFEKIAIAPEPAIKSLPDWYKNMESYHGGKLKISERGSTNLTAKKCVPMFDALTSGYFIKLPLEVLFDNGGVSWTSNLSGVMIHPGFQIEGFETPVGFTRNVFKWENPWVLKTPPGYSTLFTHPMARPDLPFFSFSAIVDTDTWDIPIHFPFLPKENFSGVVERGTPIIQAIPFKREPWEAKSGGLAKDVEKDRALHFAHIRNHYRKKFWQKKWYR